MVYLAVSNSLKHPKLFCVFHPALKQVIRENKCTKALLNSW